MKNQIVWVDIPVVRLERAIAFYSEILNGEVKKESGHADIVFGFSNRITHVSSVNTHFSKRRSEGKFTSAVHACTCRVNT